MKVCQASPRGHPARNSHLAVIRKSLYQKFMMRNQIRSNNLKKDYHKVTGWSGPHSCLYRSSSALLFYPAN